MFDSRYLTLRYRNENNIFAKLAQQRAQLSITDSNLYDNYPANNSIKFGPLGDQEFGGFLNVELIFELFKKYLYLTSCSVILCCLR